MTQFSSVCEVLGLPLCFAASSLRAVRPSPQLLLHTDTSFRLQNVLAVEHSLTYDKSRSYLVLPLAETWPLRGPLE
jgi:hypothetical protein